MNREITDQLSTALDIYNCIICLFMMLSVMGDLKKNKANRYFFFACLAVLIFNIADISNWQMEGLVPAWHVPALHILTFVFYMIVPFCYFFLLKYIREYLKPNKVSNWYFNLSYVISGLYFMGVIASPFSGFYYYITPGNMYRRGQYNYISTIFFGVFFLVTFIMIIANRKYFPRKSIFAFLSYVAFPITCQIIQIKFYGLSLVNLGLSCSLLLIFINAHHDLKITLNKNERKQFDYELHVLEMQGHVLARFGDLLEFRTLEGGRHSERVGELVESLARQCVKDGIFTDLFTAEYLSALRVTASFYDIGKVALPDNLINKPEKLDDYEYQLMVQHTKKGREFLEEIYRDYKEDIVIKLAKEVALFHHERWNGTGYPAGLHGEEIPVSARLFSIIDVFDALVYKRCYKEAMFIDDAIELIKNASGTQFDPILVKEFLLIKTDIMRILTKYEEGR